MEIEQIKNVVVKGIITGAGTNPFTFQHFSNIGFKPDIIRLTNYSLQDNGVTYPFPYIIKTDMLDDEIMLEQNYLNLENHSLSVGFTPIDFLPTKMNYDRNFTFTLYNYINGSYQIVNANGNPSICFLNFSFIKYRKEKNHK